MITEEPVVNFLMYIYESREKMTKEFANILLIKVLVMKLINVKLVSLVS